MKIVLTPETEKDFKIIKNLHNSIVGFMEFNGEDSFSIEYCDDKYRRTIIVEKGKN